ncbi:MAG: hypothetical protein JO081_03695 [Alphaproteobacteria bacterium]|nr:hypothetical protein [Alphaproteobacteria bacterium]
MPNCSRLGDVAQNIGIEPGAVIVKADFERRRAVFEPRLDDPQHLVEGALAMVACPRRSLWRGRRSEWESER